MGRPISYAEAVRMLGESESKLINLLDWLTGLGLAGAGLDVLGPARRPCGWGTRSPAISVTGCGA